MSPNMHQLQDALDQVRSLQDICLIKQKFYGYSGKARLMSGALTMGTAVLLWQLAPASPWTHLMGWGILLLVGLVVNYAALSYWFLNDPEVKREPSRLKPAIEALPPLAVGGLLSAALIHMEIWDLLFPVWMMCFGLCNLASRHFLARAIGLVGIFYIAAGCVTILLPSGGFTNPLIMGLVFGIGELVGGVLMWKGQTHEL